MTRSLAVTLNALSLYAVALVLAAAFFAFKRNLLPLMIGHGVHNILKMALFYFGVAM